MRKGIALLLTLALLLSGVTALGDGLPPIRPAESRVTVPDPARVLGGAGELYELAMPYGDETYDTYYYPRPEDPAAFEAAYGALLKDAGFTLVNRVQSTLSPARIGSFDQMLFTWEAGGVIKTGYILLDYGRDMLFMVPAGAGFAPDESGTGPAANATEAPPAVSAPAADPAPAPAAETAAAPAAQAKPQLDTLKVLEALDTAVTSITMTGIGLEAYDRTPATETMLTNIESMSREAMSVMAALDKGPGADEDAYAWLFVLRNRIAALMDRLEASFARGTVDDQSTNYYDFYWHISQAFGLMDGACLAAAASPAGAVWLGSDDILARSGAPESYLNWDGYAAGGYYAVYWQYEGTPRRVLKVTDRTDIRIPMPENGSLSFAICHNPTAPVFPSDMPAAGSPSVFRLTGSPLSGDDGGIRANGRKDTETFSYNGVHLTVERFPYQGMYVWLSNGAEYSPLFSEFGRFELNYVPDTHLVYTCALDNMPEERDATLTFVLTTEKGWTFAGAHTVRLRTSDNGVECELLPLMAQYRNLAGKPSAPVSLNLSVYVDDVHLDTVSFTILPD